MENFINLHSEMNVFNLDLQRRYITKDKPRKFDNSWQKSINASLEVVANVLSLGDIYGLNEWFARLNKLRTLTNKSKTELVIQFPESKINQRLKSQIHEIFVIIENEFYKNIKADEPYSGIANSFIALISEFRQWFEQNFNDSDPIIEIKSVEPKPQNVISEDTERTKKEEFPLIFHNEDTYNLFLYLREHYDNEYEPSKYSHLYHFIILELGDYSIGHKDYLKYIFDNYGLTISKIQPKNPAYTDRHLPKLTALKSRFISDTKKKPIKE